MIRDVLVVDSQLYLESHPGAKDNVETSNGTLPLVSITVLIQV